MGEQRTTDEKLELRQARSGCRVARIFLIATELLLAFVILNTVAQLCGIRIHTPVVVETGPHAGRAGQIVSVPWIGNLHNLRPTINVAATEAEIRAQYDTWGGRVEELLDDMRAGHRPREGIRVWWFNLATTEKEGK